MRPSSVARWMPLFTGRTRQPVRQVHARGRRAARRPVGSVAVLEVDPTGHRLQYLAHVAEACGFTECTLLTSAEAARSAEFAMLPAAIRGITTVLPETSSPRAVLAAAVQQARISGVARLIVLEADPYCVPALRLLPWRLWSRMEIRFLIMRTPTVGGPEPLRLAMLAKPAIVQLVRMIPRVRVLFLTDAFGVVGRRRGYPCMRAVKDPVAYAAVEQPTAPGWFPGARPGQTTVGVFGVISARKNLPLIVQAVAGVEDVVLVVAGRLEDDVRRYVESDPSVSPLIANSRMVVLDRLLDAGEFDAALGAVDMVAVLHDNDSPSGILAEACIRGTPALVPRGGWLATVVEATSIGLATEMAPRAVGDAIRMVVANHSRFVAATTQARRRLDVDNFVQAMLGV